MAVVFQNTFDGADGVTVTTTNSGDHGDAVAIVNGTVVYDESWSAAGSASILAGGPAVDAFSGFQPPPWSGGPTGMRLYLRIAPDDALDIALSPSTGGLMYATPRGNGDLDHPDGTEAGVLPVDGSAFRLEITVDGTAWGMRAFVTDPGGTTPDVDLSGTLGSAPSGDWDSWLEDYAGDGVHIDEVVITDTADWIGPVVSGTVVSPSGGVVLDGAARAWRRAMPAPSGGVVLSGSVAVSKRVTASASGTLHLSGAAAASRRAIPSASGTIALDGAVNTEQGTTLFIDYSAGHLFDPFEPVDDDQHVRNDVTVKREGGSSARHVQETGPLSVLPPPGGVGVYDESVTLNVFSDSQLADQAAWRVHLGTIDEARYPQVTVKLTDLPFLVDDVTSRDSGDWLRVINPPAWLPPRDIDLMIQGYTETIGLVTWEVTFNASNARAYTVGEVYAPATVGGPDRADTSGSRLWVDVTAEQTVFDVEIHAGPFWITSAEHPGEFPFTVRCGGEVMQVTAVDAPFGFLQQFTVARAVNGITKAHDAGTPVALAEPAIVAL